MRELSLFTGAGGGLLGTHLLGWRPVGYVEFNDYCQRVIAQRIKDGCLPDAPIFGDIRTFISEGYAESYKGMVDVITAGFPCQPFSVGGKQRGVDDDRNMWPATAETIRLVNPRSVLLENVPGIRKYLPVVVRDLRLLGYWVLPPLILGADDVGADHHRKRVWVLAHANEKRWIQEDEIQGERRCHIERQIWSVCFEHNLQNVKTSWLLANAFIDGNDNGLASDVDRLEASGNGQVPGVVSKAWEILGGY